MANVPMQNKCTVASMAAEALAQIKALQRELGREHWQEVVAGNDLLLLRLEGVGSDLQDVRAALVAVDGVFDGMPQE